MFMKSAENRSFNNDVVIKSNDLVQAKYTLNLLEQKIIMFAISKMNKNDEKFNIIKIKIKELAEILGTTAIRYSEFRKIANNLMDRKIKFKERENLDVRWLASSEYLGDGSGTIELEFSEKLIPYLLQLKARFTKYQLRNILYLNEKHSIRIYELLKQYETIKKREFLIDDLKEILCLNDKYPAFKDFDKYVIKKSIEEINRETDIIVTYEKIRIGRKIGKLSFSINKKEEDSEFIKLKSAGMYDFVKDVISSCNLRDFNFSEKQVAELYEISINKTENTQVNPLDYLRVTSETIRRREKDIKNLYSYLKKALEEDFFNVIITWEIINSEKNKPT